MFGHDVFKESKERLSNGAVGRFEDDTHRQHILKETHCVLEIGPERLGGRVDVACVYVDVEFINRFDRRKGTYESDTRVVAELR